MTSFFGQVSSRYHIRYALWNTKKSLYEATKVVKIN